MKLITVKKAAEILGTTEQHVRRLIRDDKIAAEWGEEGWEIDPKSVRVYDRRRPPVGRPVGTISTEPARSRRYGDGTPEAERMREYNREYQRRKRSPKARRK